MNNVLNKLKKSVRQLLGFLPSKLPTGMTEFDKFVESFINTYDLPTKDLTSIRFILASTTLNLSSTTAYKSKFYFFLLVSAACAKQIAGSVFQDIKVKQREADAAAKASAV